MTMAEFNAVVHKHVALRVIIRAVFAVLGGALTVFAVAIGPVLWVYGNVESNRKDVARLEEQMKGLSRTVGELQLTVAAVGSEVKANRSDSAAILRLMEAQQRPAPPARTANVPTRRTTQ